VSSIQGKQIVVTTNETLRVGAPAGFRRLVWPLFEFIELESAGALTLVVAATMALAWANSPWSDVYQRVWGTTLSLHLGGFALHGSLAHAINDGLMAVFFLLVGLEIKRELVEGRLSGIRKAVLPAAAALGGMVVPALVYAVFSAGAGSSNAGRGWGVPMATDIAFSLGVLALLGSHRVPIALKVFLTALAIIDDLGAVLAIAIFYRAHLSWPALAVAAGTFALLLALNRLGVRRLAPYLLIGLVLWLAVLRSGIHSTVAGVLLALAVPLRVKPPLGAASLPESAYGQNPTPLHRLERTLHPFVSFLILPLFALANAGLAMHGPILLSRLASPVSLGTIAGLFLGKPAGILGACWLATKLGVAECPAGVNWRQLRAVACLGGIGFTMSLFISNLAFPGGPELVEQAKAGIIFGSLASAITGLSLSCRAPRRTGRPPQTRLRA